MKEVNKMIGHWELCLLIVLRSLMCTCQFFWLTICLFVVCLFLLCFCFVFVFALFGSVFDGSSEWRWFEKIF